MAFWQIQNMDAYPDASAISSEVIIAKHAQFCSLTCCNLGDIGHVVAGNATV